MPLVKPQELKSLNTISLQPDKITPKIDMIVLMDLAGKGTNDIARELGMTAARISIIKNSPLYIQERDVQKAKLQEIYRDKQSDRLVSGDPVEIALKEAALSAAKTKIDLMHNGKSEFVKLAASGDILDRAGYRPHQEKTKVSIEITDKMADRFEAALGWGSGSGRGNAAKGGKGLLVGEVEVDGGTERGEATSDSIQTEQQGMGQVEVRGGVSADGNSEVYTPNLAPDSNPGVKVTITREEFI